MEKKYTLNINDSNLNKIVSTRRQELPDKIREYKENHLKVKVDKIGNVTDDNNQYLMSIYFFKSINPMPNVIPVYDSDQLSKVWELYNHILEQVNMEIGLLPPTLSHFCKFAGISMEKLQEYKYDVNENMRILIEKIYNETFDVNVLLSQNKKLAGESTKYRMKVENEAIEKKAPTVNVNIGAKVVDLDKINGRLAEIKRIASQRINYEEKANE